MRIQRQTASIAILAAFLFLFLASALAGPAFADSSAPSRKGSNCATCADMALDRFARVPDSKVSLANFLFLVSTREGSGLTGHDHGTAAAEKELDRLAQRVADSLQGTRDPIRTVSVLNRILFEQEGFAYDQDPGNPEKFLLENVLEGRHGNCLGLTSLYLAIGDRLGLPLRAVYVPSHCFVRYEGNGACINIETGQKGAERKNGWYAEKFALKEGSPYLRSLGKKETIGLYLKSLGTASSRGGSEDKAIHWYEKASRFYPDLPDIHYNAGVSYQRMGKNEEAIEKYVRALSLYADMAAARSNLFIALKTSRLTREKSSSNHTGTLK